MKYIKCCRNCKSKNIKKLFSLGNLSFSGKFPKVNEKIPKTTLTLIICEICKLVQLKESFDLKLSARTKNIQAFGFFMGAPQIIKQNQINSLDSWFLNLREIIRKKILNNFSVDVANVGLALLIG